MKPKYKRYSCVIVWLEGSSLEDDKLIAQDSNTYRFATKKELTAFLDGVDAAKGYIDSLVFATVKEYRRWLKENFRDC